MITIKYDGKSGHVLNVDGRTFDMERVYQFTTESLLPRPLKKLESYGLEISDSDQLRDAIVDWIDTQEVVVEKISEKTEGDLPRGGVSPGSTDLQRPISTVVSVRGGISAT